MIRNKNALRGFALGILAAIVVVGLGLVPVLAHGAGQPPAPQAYQPEGFGGTSPLVIPAAAFTSDGQDPDGFFFDFAGGYVNGVGTACLKAPVYLPRGVVVYAVRASLYDNATGNVYVYMRRVNRNTGAGDVMAALRTLSDSTSIQQPQDRSIDYPHIGDLYSTYYYYVTTCLDSANHRLYAVQIDYGPHRQFLPVILRRSH
jgi:hypothetical protein